MNISNIQKYVSLIKSEVALLDLSTLPCVLLAEDVHRDLPLRCSAIYFVTDESGSELLYIGKSVDLKARWKPKRNIYGDIMETDGWNSTWLRVMERGGSHLRWLACPRELVTVIEIAAIQRLKPIWNQARN